MLNIIGLHTAAYLRCISACRKKLRYSLPGGTVAHHGFGSRRPSTTTLSQSTTPYCATALPAEHVRAPSGLFGRRSYFVELFTGSSPWSMIEFRQFSRKPLYNLMLWFVNWCILFGALYANLIICWFKLYYPVTFIFSRLFFKGGVVFCFNLL